MPEKLTIVTPQFEREPGAPTPAPAPSDWDGLKEMDVTALRELGCRRWNDPSLAEDGDEVFGGKTLMLFPGEWYRHIPEGFPIVGISGEREHFEPGVADDDIRFGCLPYGILV